MDDATGKPESGVGMDMDVYIAKVLQSVVDGVLLAQGAGIPASLPSGVDFVVSLADGDVMFTVPLSSYLFDNRSAMVTYSGSRAKN